ncbi:MAG: hypothetical protein BHW64_05005 [Candidatus Melainabacteria bacterium LEY3_CP_29_8]|nr:MAG: hypothetical protein BHW64_05005 [Candidatus Melainabacteria bacterium LEY3_CP_29_8]
MGVDTVKFSTNRNMYTIYYEWRSSGSKLNFKSYLLEDNERIKDFANSFIRYNSGDMFTRESVVELEDGRLLCFDPDEFSKAYVIDFSNITKDDINFDRDSDFKMIRADQTKPGYETRNSAIISYLGKDIKTKDGEMLESYLSTASFDEPDSTQINPNSTNLFYYINISQMSNDEEEQEYYRNIIESLGGQVDDSGQITVNPDSKTPSALSKLNDKIKLFKKYLDNNDNQSKFNTLILLQQLGLSELELIEKLSPGFLEQIGAYTADYEGISYTDNTYTDNNGFQSSLSQVISFEKVITYKYNNTDKYWMYLSFEDRKNVFENNWQNNAPSDPISNAAQALTRLSSSTSESIESTMAQNLENHISETTIENYINDFTKLFSDKHIASGHTYDEALEYLAMLCTENVSGEILYIFLQDENVQQCLAILGAQKGTLPTAKTADKPVNEQLTIQLVYSAMIEKINTFAQDAYTVMGDTERIEAQKAVNATIGFLDAAAGGTNVKYNENKGWFFVGGLGGYAVEQAGLAVWANRAANNIVEKATTETLKNGANNVLVKEAEKAAKEAKAAKDEAYQAAIDTWKNLQNAEINKNQAFSNMLDDIISKTEFKKIPTDMKDSEFKEAQELYKRLENYKLDNIGKNNNPYSDKDHQLLKKYKDLFKNNGINCDDFINKYDEYQSLSIKYKKQYDDWNTKNNDYAQKEKAFNDAFEETQTLDNAADINKLQEAADHAAKELKTAKQKLNNNIDNIIKQISKDPKNKDLIQDLMDLKKGNLDESDILSLKKNLRDYYSNLGYVIECDLEKNLNQSIENVKFWSEQAQNATKAAKEAAKSATEKAAENADSALGKLKNILDVNDIDNYLIGITDKEEHDKVKKVLEKIKSGSLLDKDDVALLNKHKKALSEKGLNCDDFLNKYSEMLKTSPFDNAADINKLQEAADDAADALKTAKEFRATTKRGIVDTLNDDLSINRHGASGTGDDVGHAIAKSVDFDDADNIGIRQFADGSEDLAQGITKKTSKKAAAKGGKATAQKATTATKTLRLSGALSKLFMAVDCVSSAIDGGTIGYSIGSLAVESNEGNFINPDGSYDTRRADVVKTFSTISGTLLGFSAGMYTSGTGAAINAASAGVGTIISVAAAAAGFVFAGLAALTCFTRIGK